MGNPDHSITVINFMAILQSIDYNKFERFSNVSDEISAKILSGFLDCEVLVIVPDLYGFEFSIEGAERKRRTEDSSHIRSSGPQMFFKLGVLKNFANFTGKHLCWSLFLIKLQK